MSSQRAARGPVALAPDDVLDVELADVRLHPRRDGVALRLAGDHQVDGLAGAVLAGVGAVAADAGQVEDRVDGRAEPRGVGVDADAAAPAGDARAVAAPLRRSRGGRTSPVVALATGFGLGLGLATALTPATPTASGASGAASAGADDGRCAREPGAGGRAGGREVVGARGGGAGGRHGEGQRGGAGVDGQRQRDDGSAQDADGGDGLQGPGRAEAREAVGETAHSAGRTASTGGAVTGHEEVEPSGAGTDRSHRSRDRASKSHSR